MKKFLSLLFIFICITTILIVPCYGADDGIIFTEDEIIFIEENPVIQLGVDPNFLPFEFIDKDGKYKGITADYLSLISEKTGMQFEAIRGLTWPEAYEMGLKKDVDVLPAISKTEEREVHFLFSKPYYYFKRVIVTRDTDTGISGIEDLEKLAVAVQRNSSHHSYLLSYPKINLSLYDSVEAALTSVANGTERAFVGNLATTNYLIGSSGLTNLKFTAFEAEKQQALYFAVRSDWPQLVSILNKAMDTITEEEKIAINNKWIDLGSPADYGPIIRVISIIGVFIVTMMAVSIYWIIRLKKEVKRRQLIQIDLEEAKREAEDANEFKSNFMARMSHEIRTPLNAITGISYLLKKTEISQIQIIYIDRITQASKNMLSIINDILDYSKIEAGKVELDIITFNMDKLIQDVINIVSYKIEEQKIGFRLSKDPLVPSWFSGDPKRIQQIIINILNNAAKFTSTGEVSLDIRLVAKENDKYHLAFSIHDTGIGMTKEQVEKVFVPFTQGDSSINRRFGGSGLGLSIVKNLVDMMGGQLQVFSTLGEGSTFIVNLSLIQTMPENSLKFEIIDKLNVEKLDKSHLVLLVEDNNTNQLIAKSLLDQVGIRSIIASDGKFAVELYQQHMSEIDLILMDLHMPIMNGYEASEKIRKISSSVPIVAMTADVILGVKEKCDKIGINYYISKPFDPDNFIETVIDIIERNMNNNVKNIPVLDKSLGLKNIGCDMEVYVQILNEYFNENKDTIDQLSSAISQRKYSEAAQIVHKVKGSSGSIGAKALYKVSIELQKSLNDEKEEEIIPLKEQFVNLMKNLLEEIMEYQ